jgi:putative peptidoglycan lipid II flippase
VRFTQQLLGASNESDGFHFAFRMIGFFRSLFTDGSFSGLFTSYFAKYEKQEDKFGFALGVMCVFSAIFICLNILAIAFPLWITEIFTWNSQSMEKTLLISRYAKYMFPISLSMFLSSLFSSILNYYKEFFHSSFGLVLGSVVNVSLIYLSQNSPHYFYYLVAGTVSYSFIHAIYMGIVVYFKHIKNTQNIKLIRNNQFFSKVASVGIAQLVNNIIYLGVSVLLINMKTGSYSYVEYAERVTYFIFTLVAGNLSSVISPILAKAAGNNQLFQNLCNRFFSMTMFLVIFPTIMVYLHSDIVTNIIYTKNAKTNLDLISVALKFAVLGSPFWCLQRVLVTMFLSRGRVQEQNIVSAGYKFIVLILGYTRGSFFNVIYDI